MIEVTSPDNPRGPVTGTTRTARKKQKFFLLDLYGTAVGKKYVMAITGIWVDAALNLGERSLRTMERIVRAQTRRAGMPAA